MPHTKTERQAIRDHQIKRITTIITTLAIILIALPGLLH